MYKIVSDTHTGNATDKWKHSLEFYNTLFETYIDKQILNILELGCQNCGHVEIMDKVFYNANIFGVDMNPKIQNIKNTNNVKLIHENAHNWRSVISKCGHNTFDIIIEDCCHKWDVVQSLFIIYFIMFVSPGGVYVIENSQASYDNNFGRHNPKTKSTMDFFKNVIDIIHTPFREGV